MLVVLLVLPAVTWAGPIFDPFLEQFQVGAFLDPEQIDMAGIWPGGLLTEPLVDVNWTRAAQDLLTHPDRHADAMSIRFLSCLELNPYGSVAAMAAAVADLEAEVQLTSLPEGDFLKAERWRLAVFRSQSEGGASVAASLVRLGLQDESLKLSSRERFVWEMRHRYLDQLAGQDAVPLGSPWPQDDSLGPYDRGAVWAMWVAHRRAAKLPLLPATMQGQEDAARLAELQDTYLKPADLEGSAFTQPLKSGLGAAIFEKSDLTTHLRNNPTPPDDFSVQGWWVLGQRFSKRGDAAHYETLAARTDLMPGWRMDVWRRASELRLLKGQWTEGLADLDHALEIARVEGGTTSLRRRLRQWVEQAAVLALAEGRPDTAWLLLDKGDASFSGEAGEVFLSETRHWRAMRAKFVEGLQANLDSDDPAFLVESGQAPDLLPAGGNHHLKESLVKVAEEPLWKLWLKWGVALAAPEQLSGLVKERAASYSEILRKGLASEVPRAREDAALAAAAHRFSGRTEILEPLIDKIVDGDVGRLSGWASPPEPSPIPGLLPVLRQSQLDMHAALGVALAIGDMRGIVALAYELPGSGLTAEEKRRFLYPLPAEGPIRDALLAAESEPALILAVARNESLFEPAVRSRAGALGWMQIMPFHFSGRGALPGSGNWAVPGVSIALGDKILSENRRRYQGNPYLTVAAYNAGPGAAARWLDQLGGAPARDIYLAWIGYPETRNYVEKVLIDREIYAWILASPPAE